ncbi:hypothetical protein [Boseongicola sp. H5]|uniref:hypothetical protein n=1 Tax=Boseongicola sp. H5 TaxID=2763261 RepID=UPI001B0A3195|nr:hypothetical protein [Boseongicola sp. H5]MBO6922476.1 hypothetical protein [Roseicyclus sp.]
MRHIPLLLVALSLAPTVVLDIDAGTVLDDVAKGMFGMAPDGGSQPNSFADRLARE